MFKAAVIVTILVVPVVLLVVIQWKFLPYHSTWITLDHQLVLTPDLLLLWFFWPHLSSSSDRWRDGWSQRRPWSMRAYLVLTALMLVGVWALLVPPGGGIVGIERWIGYQSWLNGIGRNLELPERTLMRKEPPVELLFAKHVDANKHVQACGCQEEGREG